MHWYQPFHRLANVGCFQTTCMLELLQTIQGIDPRMAQLFSMQTNLVMVGLGSQLVPPAETIKL